MIRRIIAFLCCFLTVLSFVGCANEVAPTVQQSDPTESDPPEETVTETPDTTPTQPKYILNNIIGDVQAESIQYYNCATSGNFSVIKKDGLYGLVDYKGEIVLPIQYKDISQGGGFSYNYLLADDGSDSYAKYMIDPAGDLREGYPDGGGAMPIFYWCQDEYVIFDFDMGYITKQDPKPEWVYPPSINQRAWEEGAVLPVQEISDTNGAFPTLKNEYYGLLDMEGNTMKSDFIYEDFDKHNGFCCGLLAVEKDGKWGFVNEDGELVIDHLYDPYEENKYGDRIFGAVNDFIAVKQNGLWGLIDTRGEIVVPIEYESISQVNKDAMFWLLEDGLWSLYQIETA